MSNIFSGTDVPAWLVDAAKPASGKELGQFLGDQMSIMALAMQRDPNAPKDAGWWDSRRGLADAQTDVQNSKIDPMWKQNRDIKLGQWALQTQSKILQNDFTKSRIDLAASTEKNRASSLKAYTDAKLSSGGDPGKFLNMTMPAEITDPAVVNMWIKDKADAGKTAAGLAISQEAMVAGKVKLDRAIRLNKDQQVFSQVFDRDFTETERAAITALGNAPDGSFTPKQVIAMNDTLKAAGKPLIGQKQYAPTTLDKLKATLETMQASGNADPVMIGAYKSAIAKESQSGKYEEIDIGGHRFLRLGNQLRDLSGLSPAQKTMKDLAVSRVNRIENALIKLGVDSTGNVSPERMSLTSQLSSAKKSLERALAKAPNVAPTTGTSEPSTQPAPNPGRFKVEVLPTQ